jgi:hypothetical protein
MAKKENKGGFLTSEQVEKDNRVKGKAEKKTTNYIGSQDTGEGSPVKKDPKENKDQK